MAHTILAFADIASQAQINIHEESPDFLILNSDHQILLTDIRFHLLVAIFHGIFHCVARILQMKDGFFPVRFGPHHIETGGALRVMIRIPRKDERLA